MSVGRLVLREQVDMDVAAGRPPGDSEDARPDTELITSARAGDEAAVDALWRRHVGAAGRAAVALGPAHEVDDLVSEAFARVLQILRSGGGPHEAFRAYLLSTMRRLRVDAARHHHRLVLTAVDEHLEREPLASTEDLVVDRSDAATARAAWSSLPEETRILLWHLVVEQESPAEIAPLLGISANAVASRGKRARERLRQAYLTEGLATSGPRECRPVRGLLGAHVREALSARDRRLVDEHLATCPLCRAALAEVSDTASLLRRVVSPGVAALPALAALAALRDILGPGPTLPLVPVAAGAAAAGGAGGGAGAAGGAAATGASGGPGAAAGAGGAGVASGGAGAGVGVASGGAGAGVGVASGVGVGVGVGAGVGAVAIGAGTVAAVLGTTAALVTGAAVLYGARSPGPTGTVPTPAGSATSSTTTPSAGTSGSPAGTGPSTTTRALPPPGASPTDLPTTRRSVTSSGTPTTPRPSDGPPSSLPSSLPASPTPSLSTPSTGATSGGVAPEPTDPPLSPTLDRTAIPTLTSTPARN